MPRPRGLLCEGGCRRQRPRSLATSHAPGTAPKANRHLSDGHAPSPRATHEVLVQPGLGEDTALPFVPCCYFVLLVLWETEPSKARKPAQMWRSISRAPRGRRPLLVPSLGHTDGSLSPGPIQRCLQLRGTSCNHGRVTRGFPAQTTSMCIFLSSLPRQLACSPSQCLAVVPGNREELGCIVIRLAQHTALILIHKQLQTLTVYVKPQSPHEKI